MPKSCFDGYLTDECKNCPDWKDRDNNDGVFGCATKLPIMLCPYFKKMLEQDEKERRLKKEQE